MILHFHLPCGYLPSIHQFITIHPKQRASPQDTILQKLLLLPCQRPTQSSLHLPIPMLIHYPSGHNSLEGAVQMINPSKAQNFFPSCHLPHWVPRTASAVLRWPNCSACSQSTRWSKQLPVTTPIIQYSLRTASHPKNFQSSLYVLFLMIDQSINRVRTWHCRTQTHLLVRILNLLLHFIRSAKQLLNHSHTHCDMLALWHPYSHLYHQTPNLNRNWRWGSSVGLLLHKLTSHINEKI